MRPAPADPVSNLRQKDQAAAYLKDAAFAVKEQAQNGAGGRESCQRHGPE
jgi:hypothetical protein